MRRFRSYKRRAVPVYRFSVLISEKRAAKEQDLQFIPSLCMVKVPVLLSGRDFVFFCMTQTVGTLRFILFLVALLSRKNLCFLSIIFVNSSQLFCLMLKLDLKHLAAALLFALVLLFFRCFQVFLFSILLQLCFSICVLYYSGTLPSPAVDAYKERVILLRVITIDKFGIGNR